MAKGKGSTIHCVCGSPMRRDNIERHLKGKRHHDTMAYVHGDDYPQKKKDELERLLDDIKYNKEKFSPKRRQRMIRP